MSVIVETPSVRGGRKRVPGGSLTENSVAVGAGWGLPIFGVLL